MATPAKGLQIEAFATAVQCVVNAGTDCLAVDPSSLAAILELGLGKGERLAIEGEHHVRRALLYEMVEKGFRTRRIGSSHGKLGEVLDLASPAERM